MKLFGLDFPRDHIPRPDHGPYMRFLVSLHPLALWIPAAIIGLLVGLLR